MCQLEAMCVWEFLLPILAPTLLKLLGKPSLYTMYSKQPARKLLLSSKFSTLVKMKCKSENAKFIFKFMPFQVSSQTNVGSKHFLI